MKRIRKFPFLQIATLLALPAAYAVAQYIVPETDATTGAVRPPALEERIAGAYKAATNAQEKAEQYVEDRLLQVKPEAIAAATENARQMVVTGAVGIATAEVHAYVATGIVAKATEVIGPQKDLIEGAVQLEVDPVFAAHYDAIMQAINSKLATETDPVWKGYEAVVLQAVDEAIREELDPVYTAEKPGILQAIVNSTNELATVAHTGDYDDLLNKPLSFSETDPVAIPRIEALEANTNHWNAAITNEQDLAALRLYHYGSTDIVESPDDWFTWTVSGGKATVTGLNWGGEWWDPPDDPAKLNIVIPWEYDGVPVEAIGDFAFSEYELDSLRAPKTLVSVESHAFAYADIGSLSLPAATSAGDAVFVGLYTPSLHLPAATSIGSYAFMDANISSLHLPAATTLGDEVFSFAHSLGSITFSRMPTTIGVDIFNGVSPLPTVYITDLTDPNTDTSLQDAPIVRPGLHADSLTLGGDTITEWPSTGGTPEWLMITNLSYAVTITNVTERPIHATLSGDISVHFVNLTPPLPVYVVLAGADSVTFPGATILGGGHWQEDKENHFIVWRTGNTTFIQPIGASDEL